MIDPIALNVFKDFLQQKLDPEWLSVYYPLNEENLAQFLYETVRYGLKPLKSDFFAAGLSSTRRFVYAIDDEFIEIAVSKEKPDIYEILNVYYVKPVQVPVMVTEYETQESSLLRAEQRILDGIAQLV